jgi:energy-coupling factor transport system ATP-binding protein
VLELEGVSYTYPGAVAPALRDLTLEIPAGQLVVLAGDSGSGKSTLLRAAGGLVPHFHGGTFAGCLRVAGLDSRDHGPGDLSSVVGSLFQDPETQVVMGTVRAELAFPLENRGEPAAAIARAVEEVALALRIADLLDRSTAELSGGELQRVALGAALVGHPQLVVLDEPTSQLDPVAGDELIGLLRRCNEDFDTTILLCEHRLERCLAAADRVLVLERGALACDAAPEEFLEWAGRHAPALQTPGARLLGALDVAPVPGVKRARAALRQRGVLPPADAPAAAASDVAPGSSRRRWSPRRQTAEGGSPVLELRHVWHELTAGPVILRDVSLALAAGERVALMGRNGAGKSTLLRHAAGLVAPTRGEVRSAGRVALLLQNPNDYLVHELVAAEASAAALARVGLDPAVFGQRHPRELSGGERQRLALAIVLGHEDSDPSAQAPVVCLDEPTRGMDRRRKGELADLLAGLDAAVLVATHDPEFVAAFANRVVLLAGGAPIADGPVREILAGGSYFATETARILGGRAGALTPAEGVAALTVSRPGAHEVLARTTHAASVPASQQDDSGAARSGEAGRRAGSLPEGERRPA